MSKRSYRGPGQTRGTRRRWRGQALVEFGITIPMLLVVILGIFQLSFLIYQQYVALNLAREGANLILRADLTKPNSFDDAANAIRQAQGDPKSFDADSKLILSVVKLGDQPGPTQNQPIIIQRHVWGMATGTSLLGNPPADSYKDGTQNYVAWDSAQDTGIIANRPLPNGLLIQQGFNKGPVYVAEIYRKRRDIVPLAGVKLPDSLYAVAYF